VRKQFLPILFLLTSGGVLSGSALAAVTEPQTPPPPAPPLSVAPQAPKPLKLTPEQEAALVEVRKILREASEVPQGVGTTNPESKEGKLLEGSKFSVLQSIAAGQARAGDIEGALRTNESTKYKGALGDIAVAQAKAGDPYKALKTASTLNLDVDALQVIIEALASRGDLKTAREVAESPGMYLRKAPALAYLAQLQTKTGDPGAKETFQRALEVAQAFDKLD